VLYQVFDFCAATFLLHRVCHTCLLYRAVRPFWLLHAYASLLANSVTGPLATYVLGYAFNVRGQNNGSQTFLLNQLQVTVFILLTCLFLQDRYWHYHRLSISV